MIIHMTFLFEILMYFHLNCVFLIFMLSLTFHIV